MLTKKIWITGGDLDVMKLALEVAKESHNEDYRYIVHDFTAIVNDIEDCLLEDE